MALVLLGVAAALLPAPYCIAEDAKPASATVAPGPCVAKPVDYASFDATVDRLRQLYRAEEFRALDEALSCLMASPAKFRSGKSGAAAVYWVFRRQMPAPGVDAGESARVRKWIESRPTSMFARFAELRLRYALAWNVRGRGYAGSISEATWKAFAQGIVEAERALHGADDALKDTPIWHNLFLAVAMDSSRNPAETFAVFEKGVSRWPDYYDFHEVALSRFVPKWGGNWGAVDRFIASWSEARKATEGDSLYARLYISVISGGEDPNDTKVSWPRLKTSMDELVRRYPDAEFKNVSASLACGYRDLPYLAAAMERLREAEIDRSYWLPGTTPAACAPLIKSRGN